MDNSAKIDADACEWVARSDRQLTAEEKVALQAWLAGDPRRRGALLRAEACYAILDRGRALAEPTYSSEPDRVEAQDAWTRRRLVRVAGGGMAAALIAAIAWSSWPTGASFDTVPGEMRRLSFDDGSLALLNTNSRASPRFSQKRRDIELSRGEAWFSVAKDKKRPFTVDAGAAYVQAVGTAFSVRRYDDRIDVIVTEGVVKVWSDAGGGLPASVRAGHEATVDGRGRVSIVGLAQRQIDGRLAWREGRIVLNGGTLGEAAGEFNRYNKRQLVVSPELANMSIVGSFRTSDLDGFTRAAAAAVDATVTARGDVIRLSAVSKGVE